MSQSVPHSPTVQGLTATGQPRKRRPRAIPKARPAFFVIQVLDEKGEPIAFDKRRIKVLLVERDAEVVMDMTDRGEHPHAFYIRGMMPPGRVPNVAQPPRTPAT